MQKNWFPSHQKSRPVYQNEHTVEFFWSPARKIRFRRLIIHDSVFFFLHSCNHTYLYYFSDTGDVECAGEDQFPWKDMIGSHILRWKDWKISDDVFHPLQKRHTTGPLPQFFLIEKRASAKASFAGRKIIRSGEKVDGSRGNSVVVWKRNCWRKKELWINSVSWLQFSV